MRRASCGDGQNCKREFTTEDAEFTEVEWETTHPEGTILLTREKSRSLATLGMTVFLIERGTGGHGVTSCGLVEDGGEGGVGDLGGDGFDVGG
jgi:hypothetical protein